MSIILPNHLSEEQYIEVIGAREHNLKNISVKIPRNQLVVITGLSGSGKSSLAFNTIYAEGQRRYLETFSVYARQFMGNLERPDVDKIKGLSPVIAIEQKTVSKNPRSTVGTITEIYDFLRLLYARIATPHSYKTGKEMKQYTEEQVLETIYKNYTNKLIFVLAPVIQGRKGHYSDLFIQLQKKGYTKVRVDGKVKDITFNMQLDRYKIHDIEVVVDRLMIDADAKNRLISAVQLANKLTKGSAAIYDPDKDSIEYFSKYAVCADTGISYNEPAPNLFSFNSQYGMCTTCSGLGKTLTLDIEAIVPDKNIPIMGAILPTQQSEYCKEMVREIIAIHKIKETTPYKNVPLEVINEILNGTTAAGKTLKQNFLSKGLLNLLYQLHELGSNKWVSNFMTESMCVGCKGSRLNDMAMYYKIIDKNIYELATMHLHELGSFLQELPQNLTSKNKIIATEILKEINSRIQFLLNIGLDYLSLNRPAYSLSGGEAQRIRLATQLASELTEVLYVLDEPSIGLHQRDNEKLILSLQKLRDVGNSVLVVEHDKDMILAADFVLDMGPAAGLHGGEIVAAMTPAELLKQDSITANYLNGKTSIPVPTTLRAGNGKKLELNGATGHNLKNIDLVLPLGTLIGVTGVSGSGKSTLITHTLYPILSQYFYPSKQVPLPYKSIKGLEYIDKVIEINQSPIGRTPRSNPLTYTNIFSDIRNLFTLLPESKVRGYKAGRFSFNVKGGRCETCQGDGMKTIEMNFLPDVEVLCETCQGKRYNDQTLEVTYKGKSISDVLNMTVEEAVIFFTELPAICRKIKGLQEVGLGYIRLGQSSTTLSGGEAQRVKLATELIKKDTGQTFYILDEPTTGLHFQDIKVLLELLQKLVDKGNTVLVIEHNLDVIKVADHVIDIGPEGGNKGGAIVAQGTPHTIALCKESITGKFLIKELTDMPVSIINNTTKKVPTAVKELPKKEKKVVSMKEKISKPTEKEIKKVASKK